MSWYFIQKIGFNSGRRKAVLLQNVQATQPPTQWIQEHDPPGENLFRDVKPTTHFTVLQRVGKMEVCLQPVTRLYRVLLK
jgi:hypothetical protein